MMQLEVVAQYIREPSGSSEWKIRARGTVIRLTVGILINRRQINLENNHRGSYSHSLLLISNFLVYRRAYYIFLAQDKQMYYTLFNKRMKKYLEHPSYGLWCSDNKEEALDMLKVCHEYIKSMGIEDMTDDFILAEFESIDDLHEQDRFGQPSFPPPVL